jgi:RHS repeat-associated protein
MPMPGRNIVGDYRYNFQGQELDKETGKVAFEARLYDPRIMRWLTTDPAGEFHSPYLAMGNNFPNVIDPDGRCTTCPDNAKIGDTYEHAEFGTLEYTANGWGSDSAGFVMDDIVVVGTNFSREPGVGVNTFSVPNSMTVGDFQQNIRNAVGSIKARHDMHVLGLTTDLAIDVTLTLGVNAIFPAGRVAPRPSLTFAPKFNPISVGDDIALGLGDDLFNFAGSNGFKTYKNFSTGIQMEKISAAIHNPANRLHFNLNGFSRVRYYGFNPSTPLNKINYGNITNWELNTILNNPGVLQRTTFYRGGVQVPVPRF